MNSNNNNIPISDFEMCTNTTSPRNLAVPTQGPDFDTMQDILAQFHAGLPDSADFIDEVFCTPPSMKDAISDITKPDTVDSSTLMIDTSPPNNDGDDNAMDIGTDFDLSIAADMIREKREKERKPTPDEVTRYTCTLCGKNYKRRSDAHAHVQERHLNMTNFVCPHCGKKWNRKWVYERHLRNVHNVKIDGAGSSSSDARRGGGSESSQNNNNW